jgi:hypothetical protein
MRRVVSSLTFVVVAASTALAVQSGDVNRILSDARRALGGDKKLAAVKTFAATGLSTRVVGEQSTAPADAEVAFELPDKFMKKDVLATLGTTTITRTSGFNGDAPIEVIDQPPSTGGNVVVFKFGSGASSEVVTSEQKEAARNAQAVAAKQDFARLTLGFLLASPTAYPLQFAYGGQAESPDGKADVIDVTGEGGFAVRLFIDTTTHLPLMLSWMAKEPLVISQTVGSGGPGRGAVAPRASAGGAASVGSVQIDGGKPLTPEDREKLMKQLEQQRQELEAKRRTVEYRLYYGDYRDVDGIKVPFKLQRSIDGKPTEELTFDKVKINAKIDAKTFDVK